MHDFAASTLASRAAATIRRQRVPLLESAAECARDTLVGKGIAMGIGKVARAFITVLDVATRAPAARNSKKWISTRVVEDELRSGILLRPRHRAGTAPKESPSRAEQKPPGRSSRRKTDFSAMNKPGGDPLFMSKKEAEAPLGHVMERDEAVAWAAQQAVAHPLTAQNLAQHDAHAETAPARAIEEWRAGLRPDEQLGEEHWRVPVRVQVPDKPVDGATIDGTVLSSQRTAVPPLQPTAAAAGPADGGRAGAAPRGVRFADPIVSLIHDTPLGSRHAAVPPLQPAAGPVRGDRVAAVPRRGQETAGGRTGESAAVPTRTSAVAPREVAGLAPVTGEELWQQFGRQFGLGIDATGREVLGVADRLQPSPGFGAMDLAGIKRRYEFLAQRFLPEPDGHPDAPALHQLIQLAYAQAVVQDSAAGNDRRPTPEQDSSAAAVPLREQFRRSFELPPASTATVHVR